MAAPAFLFRGTSRPDADVELGGIAELDMALADWQGDARLCTTGNGCALRRQAAPSLSVKFMALGFVTALFFGIC